MASKDVMIDIETLSLDSDALVLSVGAIEFHCSLPEDQGPWYGDEFFATPSIIEQLLLGRSVQQGTQMFWKNQDRAVQDHWAGPAVNQIKVGEMLTNLYHFVEGAPRVWANGSVFDIGILESLYKQFKIAVPWKYNAVRDARTAYDLMPDNVRTFNGPVHECIAHHPLGDCRSQIMRLWERGLKTGLR